MTHVTKSENVQNAAAGTYVDTIACLSYDKVDFATSQPYINFTGSHW